VLVLGGVSWNSVVYLPELPRPRPHTLHQAGFYEGVGSTGAGKALALAKLGVRHQLLAALGEDTPGDQAAAALRAQGVQLERLCDPSGTERHLNLLDAQGQRISIFTHPASDTVPFDPRQLAMLLAAADVVVLNIGAYCRPWVEAVRGCGKPVWVDLHDYDGHNPYHQPFIEVATHLQFSHEAAADPEALMGRFIGQGKALVLCTEGRHGARARTAEGLALRQPAEPGLALVDSNGAGDAFMMGWLHGWLQGEPPTRCLRMASLCGGHTVTERGLVFSGLSRAWLSQAMTA
jgi:acarbose 7IV-phosphotransferase